MKRNVTAGFFCNGRTLPGSVSDAGTMSHRQTASFRIKALASVNDKDILPINPANRLLTLSLKTVSWKRAKCLNITLCGLIHSLPWQRTCHTAPRSEASGCAASRLTRTSFHASIPSPLSHLPPLRLSLRGSPVWFVSSNISVAIRGTVELIRFLGSVLVPDLVLVAGCMVRTRRLLAHRHASCLWTYLFFQPKEMRDVGVQRIGTLQLLGVQS